MIEGNGTLETPPKDTNSQERGVTRVIELMRSSKRSKFEEKRSW